MNYELPAQIRKTIIERVNTPGYYHLTRGWAHSSPGLLSFSAQQHLGIENSRIVEMRCRSQRSPVVLEVGIGHGNTLTELKHKIPHIIPIGMDIYISDESKQKAKTSNLLLIEGNAEEIPIRDDSVDILYSVQTYRYTCDKLKFLSEAYRVISPEGLALIEIGPDWSEYSTPGIQEIITSAGLSSAFEIDKILLFGRKKTTSDTRVLKIRPAGKKKELNWRVKFLGSRTSRYYTESSYEIK